MFHTISDVRSQRSIAADPSVFARSKFEKMMIHKLAYEWKNIYRGLTQIDEAGTGLVKLDEFHQVCEKFKVSIIPLESKQLMKQFGCDAQEQEVLGLSADQASDLLGYKKLSVGLGLHKSSYNYLNKVQSLNRIKNMSKLRQLYTSIDSPPKKNELFSIDEEGQHTSGKLARRNNQGHKSTSGMDPYAQDTRTPYQSKTKMRLKSSIGASRKTQILLTEKPRGRSSDTREGKATQIRVKKMDFTQKRNSYNSKQQDYINRLTA